MSEDILDFSGKPNCGGEYRRWTELIAATAQNPRPPDNSKPLAALVVPPSPFIVPKGWGYYL